MNRTVRTIAIIAIAALVVASAPTDGALAAETDDQFRSLAIGGGDIHEFGDATFMGSLSDVDLARPVVAMASTPARDGYWLVTDGGAVHHFGSSAHHGDTGSLKLAAPVVDIAATPSGAGYWLVGADGGVFSFGDAAFRGSAGDLNLRRNIVAISATPTGAGYWLAAADGGIFAYGDARFFGSTGGFSLNSPVVSMQSTASGNGYWLIAADGGVFAFGDAQFHGSAAGQIPAGEHVVGAAVTTSGSGYWLATDAGTAVAFGSAPDLGGVAASSGEPIAAIESSGSGYWLVSTLGHDHFAPEVPANSGSGQRIVYSNTDQRVWIVEADETVTTTYLVSGKRDTPAPGTYSVFSKSRYAYAGHDGISMEYMVRFAHGRRLAIGFHSIPTYANGQPMQSAEELGTYRSAGCVRQRVDQAEFLYHWANVGTTVIVLP